MSRHSRMYREAAEAPTVVRCQIELNAAMMEALGEHLAELSPRAVVTCGRGSSDHAATFAKYLIEARTGVLTSSAAPSLSSLYGAKTNLNDVLFLGISQSGQSPDLLAAAENARRSGATIVSLCNVIDSPLAQISHYVVPLRAGSETSIAATKSYIASLTAIVHLLASWTHDESLSIALRSVPDLLEAAWQYDWEALAAALHHAASLYVIGRGYGLGIAQEAALKLKETCGLHAEAFSAAEVRHGPMALVGEGFPVLILSQHDASRAGILGLASEFTNRNARVLVAGAEVPGAIELPVPRADPIVEPILMIQSFYRMADSLAALRGFDPDAPSHLSKVTETT